MKRGRPKMKKKDRRVYIGVTISPEANTKLKLSNRTVSDYVNSAILEFKNEN